MSDFVLEGEGLDPIVNPTIAKVRDVIDCLGRYDTSLVFLNYPNDDYLQAAGDGEACTVEKRELHPLNHWKAHYIAAKTNELDNVTLSTGAGDMVVTPDEAISLSDASELFATIVSQTDMPSILGWRNMNKVLGL